MLTEILRLVVLLKKDKAYGAEPVAEPIGVVAAVIPTTNPTSTAIFQNSYFT